MKNVVIALLALVLLTVANTPYARGLEGVEATLSIGGLLGDASRDTSIGGTEVKDDLNDGAIFLGRVGYLFYRDVVGLEASIGGSTNNIEYRTGGTVRDVDGEAVMFDAGPFFQFNAQRVSTFVNLSIGFFNFHAPQAGDTTEFTLVFGGGIKYYFSEKVGLRFDFRDHVVFLNDEAFWGEGAEDNIHLLEISGGVFYRF